MGDLVRTDYCVYTHLRPDDSIFYVGKGVPTRPYRTDGRSSFWKNEAKNNNHFVNIVKSNLTEAEAFEIEVRLIGKLKEAGIQLVNQTRGGDGCKELVFTEEVKQKLINAFEDLVSFLVKFILYRAKKVNKKQSQIQMRKKLQKI